MIVGMKQLDFVQRSHTEHVWEFHKHFSQKTALCWHATPGKELKSPPLYIFKNEQASEIV